LFSVPLVLALVRANEIAFVRVRDGRLRVARGRLPAKLIHDLGEIVARPPATRAALRFVVEDRTPRVYAEGELSDEQKQRIRNVLGGWPLAKIRNV
jgi:hypothetical protein